MSIQPIGSVSIPVIAPITAPSQTSASGAASQITQSFEGILTALNESQLSSDALIEKMAQGQDVDLHEVMIGMEENNINFNVALGIRDKLIEAYREVMRMQV